MAVTANPYSKSLKLILNKGVNPETSKEIQKTKSFTNIKAEATDDGLMTAAQTIGNLQTNPVMVVRKQELYELTNE